MKAIALLLPEQFFASGVAGLIDAFAIANFQAAASGSAVLRWRLLSVDGLPVRASSGLEFAADGRYDQVQPGELLIVPGLIYRTIPSLEHTLQQQAGLIAQLRQWHAAGHVLAGCCTGRGIAGRKRCARPPAGYHQLVAGRLVQTPLPGSAAKPARAADRQPATAVQRGHHRLPRPGAAPDRTTGRPRYRPGLRPRAVARPTPGVASALHQPAQLQRPQRPDGQRLPALAARPSGTTIPPGRLGQRGELQRTHADATLSSGAGRYAAALSAKLRLFAARRLLEPPHWAWARLPSEWATAMSAPFAGCSSARWNVPRQTIGGDLADKWGRWGCNAGRMPAQRGWLVGGAG